MGSNNGEYAWSGLNREQQNTLKALWNKLRKAASGSEGIRELPPSRYMRWRNDGRHNLDVAKFVCQANEFVNNTVKCAVDDLVRTTRGKHRGFAAAVTDGRIRFRSCAVEALYDQIKHSGHLLYENEAGYDPRAAVQYVRTAPMLKQEHRGTCMDLVLFFLGCLANAGLWPVYIQVRFTGPDRPVDHALAATWLHEPENHRPACIDESDFGDLAEKRRLCLLDCTGFADGVPHRGYKLSFDKSRALARRQLHKGQYRFAVDIVKAWERTSPVC